MFNEDFYPTPPSLIEKMLECVDLRKIKNILEPSAGKGNLIEALIEENKKHYSRFSGANSIDIDCIEIDQNLRYILKGKGYRVVNDDFLKYDSYKKYALIFANFPFSDGDKHLRKALDMLENCGGQLVCLVNVETLRNAYSNTRKEINILLDKYNADIQYLQNEFTDAERKTNVEVALINVAVEKKETGSILLDRYNADIQYLQNEFTDAERKTNVEVALINVAVERKETGSILLDNLKKAQEVEEKQFEAKYIVDNDFFKAIITKYTFEVKVGLKLIDEYKQLESFTNNSFSEKNTHPILSLRLHGDRSCLEPKEDQMRNEYIRAIRYKYWEALFNSKEFTKLLTTNLRCDFQNQLEELKDYDFNMFNIKELQAQMNMQVIQGVKETILSLFDEFSHKHYYGEGSKNIHMFNGWKTNSCYKINKKVIIPLNGFDDWNNRYYPTKYNVTEKLGDIEKVFNYLDSGKSEEVNLFECLKYSEDNNIKKKVDTKYFSIDFYLKGTAHLVFKDEELLKKFNRFGAENKGWLPPGYGKKKYKDMTKEEQEVINSFEGKETYETVMTNPQEYIYQPSNMLLLG